MKFVHLFTVRYIFNKITEVNFGFPVKYSPFKIIDRGSFFAVFVTNFVLWFEPFASHGVASQQERGVRGVEIYEHKVCFTCAGSPLSGQCELYAHVFVGVLTLWPETFLGNAVPQFQRLLHRSARLVLYCLGLRFPTERVLGICRLRAAYTSTRSPRYVFIYA